MDLHFNQSRLGRYWYSLNKWGVLFCALFFLTAPCLAQYVTVNATIVDAGGNPATSGTVVFSLQPQGNGILYYIQGVGTIVPQTVTCAIQADGTLKNATSTGACLVAGNDIITPQNTLYQAKFYPNKVLTNTVGQLMINTSASPYNLNTPIFGPVVAINPQYQTLSLGPAQANVIPGADSVFTLGDAGHRWSTAYINSAIFGPGLVSIPNLTVTSSLTLPPGIPTGNGAMSANAVCATEPISVVLCYGAVGDNSTSNDTVFATMTSDMNTKGYTRFWFPAGFYKTSLSSVPWLPEGPGSVVLNNSQNSTLPGTPSVLESNRSIGLDGFTTYLLDTAVDLTWIGDSITQGYVSGSLTPTNFIYAYPVRIQQAMNNRSGGVGQGNYMSGGAMDRLVTTGSTSFGTNGPVGRDIILQPGATASFTANYILNVAITTFNSPTGGTITISGTAGNWGSGIATNVGSGEVKNSGKTSPDNVDYATQTITFTCAGNPCEITNIVAGTLPNTNTTSTFTQVDAQGGYCTTQFASASVLNSIVFNRQFIANNKYSIAMIDLGTNDIYGSPICIGGTSLSQFKTNYNTIISTLKTAGIAPILIVPTRRAVGSGFAPLQGTFDQFRDIIYQLARTYETPIADKSELDLPANVLLAADGTHPTQDGMGAIADFLLNKLGMTRLVSYPYGNFSGPITVQSPTANSATDIVLGDNNNVPGGSIGVFGTNTAPFSAKALSLESFNNLEEGCGFSGSGNLCSINFRINRATNPILSLTGGGLFIAPNQPISGSTGNTLNLQGGSGNGINLQGGSGTTNDVSFLNAAGNTVLSIKDTGEIVLGPSGTLNEITGPASNPVTIRGGSGATNDLVINNAANTQNNFIVADDRSVTIPGQSGNAGQVVCYGTGGKLGHCTSTVGAGGACTCVAP